MLSADGRRDETSTTPTYHPVGTETVFFRGFNLKSKSDAIASRPNSCCGEPRGGRYNEWSTVGVHPVPSTPRPRPNLALIIAALAASALVYALAAFRVAASSAAARTPPCRSSLETSGAKSCPDLATSAARARTRCSCCK